MDNLLLSYFQDTVGVGHGLALFPNYHQAGNAFHTARRMVSSGALGQIVDADASKFRISFGAGGDGGRLDFRVAGPGRPVPYGPFERLRRWWRGFRGKPVTLGFIYDIWKYAALQYRWIWVAPGVDRFSRQYILSRLRDPLGGPVYFNGEVVDKDWREKRKGA